MRWLQWWFAGYVLLVIAVVGAMLAARERALTRLATPQSIHQWQAWREGVRQQQAQPQSVERRVPKSPEPPALVLMRDHFAVSLAGAVLFSTALYWVVAWFITGMVRKT